MFLSVSDQSPATKSFYRAFDINPAAGASGGFLNWKKVIRGNYVFNEVINVCFAGLNRTTVRFWATLRSSPWTTSQPPTTNLSPSTT